MCPPTTTCASTSAQCRPDVRLRRRASQVLGVGTRRRVAEDDAAEPVELELDQSPATPRRSRARRQSAGRGTTPSSRRTAVRTSRSQFPRDEHGVPAAERVQALRLKRPPEHVPADHDPLDALALDLRENRLERRQVSVDVVERRDAHAVEATPYPANGSLGPAQTRSSAGQSAHVSSTGAAGTRRRGSARSPPRARPRAQACPPP